MHGRTSTRWLGVLVAGVVLGVLVLGVLYRLAQEQWREPARNHERVAAAHVDAFCAEQALLAAEPFFSHPVPAQPRDASRVLWPKLSPGGATADGGVSADGGATASAELVIPRGLLPRLRGDFMADLTTDDVAAVDTTFFASLHDFDRWELTGTGSPLTLGGRWTAVTAPLPDFVGLLHATKLHLRRGAAEGTVREAARDVRQAAWLAYSTETLLGAMAAVAMLDIERAAWDWARAQGAPTDGWTPVSRATTERARRVLRAAPAFYSPMAGEQTFARAMGCDRVSRCSALTETVVLTSGLGDLLDEPWRSRAAAVRAATNSPQGGCSFTLARYWEAHPMTLELPPLARQPSFLFRGDLGGVLLSLSANTGALEAAFAADAGP